MMVRFLKSAHFELRRLLEDRTYQRVMFILIWASVVQRVLGSGTYLKPGSYLWKQSNAILKIWFLCKNLTSLRFWTYVKSYFQD